MNRPGRVKRGTNITADAKSIIMTSTPTWRLLRDCTMRPSMTWRSRVNLCSILETGVSSSHLDARMGQVASTSFQTISIPHGTPDHRLRKAFVDSSRRSLRTKHVASFFANVCQYPDQNQQHIAHHIPADGGPYKNGKEVVCNTSRFLPYHLNALWRCIVILAAPIPQEPDIEAVQELLQDRSSHP